MRYHSYALQPKNSSVFRQLDCQVSQLVSRSLYEKVILEIKELRWGLLHGGKACIVFASPLAPHDTCIFQLVDVAHSISNQAIVIDGVFRDTSRIYLKKSIRPLSRQYSTPTIIRPLSETRPLKMSDPSYRLLTDASILDRTARLIKSSSLPDCSRFSTAGRI